jgi:putative ABC transport system permease protein
MGVIRHKIWYDLWKNKGRTLQVVLIVGMGAFAIGMILTVRMLIIPEMHEIWQASNPAEIMLWTSPPVDDNMIRSLGRIEGIDSIEGYSTTRIEWRSSTEEEWGPATLTARDDYLNQTYTTLSLLNGSWPDKKNLGVVQGADQAFGIQLGDQLYLRIDDKEFDIEINGQINDPIALPPGFGGPLAFYASRDDFEKLTGWRDFNQILAGGIGEYDEAVMLEVATEMQDKLEAQDVESGGASYTLNQVSRVVDPNIHFFAAPIDGIFFIMGVMSIVALILALFLVYNTINAIISQQVDQIGIMKAIGAKTGQILRLYLTTVLVYGVLALMFALPLGAIAGWGTVVFFLIVFNVDPGPFTISPHAVVAMVLIALLAPLITSLIPITKGARITVREAIHTYGLSAKVSLLDRVLARMDYLSRRLVLTISNTFRHKGRLILTQITLVLSGLIFMMVMSVRESSRYTFNDILFSILRFNVSLRFQGLERASYVEELTLHHPDVKAVESWLMWDGAIRLQGQPEMEDDPQANIFGVPLPTTLYGPQMRTGRWLLPEDRQAIVLNQELAEEIGTQIGDWVTINYGDVGESDWQVVGLLYDPLYTRSVHVPRTMIMKELNIVGKANTIWIQTVDDTPAVEEAVHLALRKIYDANGVDLAPGGLFAGATASETVAFFNERFGFIITLLATMAIVIAAVGSVSLSGVLTLNVLERRREIGVMRAIGASSATIAWLMIGEGLILGWLSWIIALPLSIPAGWIMTTGLSAAFIPIVSHFSFVGPLSWLVVITILSIVASWFPARSAMRISVHESLAYF